MYVLWQGAGMVRRLVVLVALSCVAGVLVAGIALPVVAGVGVVARSGTERFEDLPEELQVLPPPTTTTFYASDGTTPIARFFEQDRTVVPLSKISIWMQRAQVAIEDDRFYEHGGADLRSLARATVNNAGGGGTQGASTLTQQLVKLSLVYAAQNRNDSKAEAAATAETLDRKLRELRYAIALEQRLTKDQILEKYLNIAYYGAGAFGVQAAAQRYFKKNAIDLNRIESATLAGLVQRPNATDPINHLAAATARRNTVLQRETEVDIKGWHLTQAQADRDKQSPIVLNRRVPKQECEAASPDYRWFCNYAKAAFLQDKSFGNSYTTRHNNLYRGGLKVFTTMDVRMQDAANAGLAKWVDPTDEAAGVVTLVEPGTGKVRGIAISKVFGDDKTDKAQTKVNIAINDKLGGSQGTLAGSTFKAFVAAYALQELADGKPDGAGLNFSIYAPAQLPRMSPVKTCDGYSNDPKYSPANESTSEQGVFDMQKAAALSINTYFLQLEEKTGVCGPATLAGSMGLHNTSTGDKLDQFQSFTLGTNNVAPLDMAAAYATFANRGIWCPAYPFEAWYNAKGVKQALRKPACTRVLDEDVADAMNYLLRGVVTSGSGRRAALSGQQVAGKTGTTQGRQQAWFMGYTTALAGSATVWDPSPPKGGYRLSGKTIGGTFYGRVQGANLPAPMWHDTVGAAIEAAGLTSEKFVQPKGKFFAGGSYAPSFAAGNGFHRTPKPGASASATPDVPGAKGPGTGAKGPAVPAAPADGTGTTG